VTREAPEILAAFRELPDARRLEALAVAVRDAYAVWRAYADPWKPVTYVDGVVGMQHQVDLDLPRRAMEDIERALAGATVDPAATDRDYTEPIVAMQDDDLEFPGEVELAYYAIYNLHRIVFQLGAGLPAEHVVIQQVANCVSVDAADWLREWWLRVWDAWASNARDP
jgi:hypothetical protein